MPKSGIERFMASCLLLTFCEICVLNFETHLIARTDCKTYTKVLHSKGSFHGPSTGLHGQDPKNTERTGTVQQCLPDYINVLYDIGVPVKKN